MQRIAGPMVCGMISLTLPTLIVIPAIYALVKGAGFPAEQNKQIAAQSEIGKSVPVPHGEQSNSDGQPDKQPG